MMKKLVAIFLLLNLFISCEKEDENIEKYYPIKYCFYNNGDTDLNRVVLYCATYFPVEDITEWSGTGKWRNASIFTPEDLLNDYDSIFIYPGLSGYSGCITVFTIGLEFLDTSGTGHIIYYSKQDTIINKIGSLQTFKWPNDSSKFDRIFPESNGNIVNSTKFR